MGNSNLFVKCYAFFIVASLLFGSFYIIGGLTVRHIATIIMLFACSRESKLWVGKGFRWYILFVVIFGFNSLLKGYYEEYFRQLIAYYFICGVSVWATYILVVKYNSIKTLFKALICMGVMNALFTIMQYLKLPGAFEVMRLFNVEDNYDKYFSLDLTIADVSYPGIFGAVHSGYNSMVATILSLYLLYKKRSILNTCIWLFLLIGLFCIQQRAAFFIGFLLSFYFLHKLFKGETGWRNYIPYLVVASIIVIAVSTVNLDDILSGSRYSTLTELGIRETIYQNSSNYIQSHILDANIYEFENMFEVAPHNLIYNAFMYGGVFAAIVVLFIVCKHLIISIPISLQKVTADNYMYILVALAFIGYNAISMTHNLSIVTGDTLYWILICPIILKYHYKYL